MTNIPQQQTAAHKRRPSIPAHSGNTITKAQWAQITEELQGYFCHVQFKYQDTVISVARERDGESRTVLSVYFDGTICGAWGNEKSESYNPLTGLFWFEKKKRLYSAKKVAEIEKGCGKRRAKEWFPKLHDSITFRLPFFTSSAMLVRQFKKVDGLIWLREKEASNEA